MADASRLPPGGLHRLRLKRQRRSRLPKAGALAARGAGEGAGWPNSRTRGTRMKKKNRMMMKMMITGMAVMSGTMME